MSVLLLESLHPDAEALLAEAAPLLRAESPTEPGPVPYEAVRAVVTRGRGRITRALLARCPALAVVARAGVGLDNVDLVAAGERKLPVVYTPGGNTATVAEHTLALLLALVRGLGPIAAAVAAGRWQARDGYAGDELGGKTLGIVGFGAIGQRVAALAAAFGVEVIVAAHPSVRTTLPVLPLEELLPRADLLTLHLPLSNETRGLIGAAALARLKPGAVLVNTARGALVDEAAVAAALTSGRLGGFAADVLVEEPPPAGAPLLSAPRALITPHVASLTATTYRQMCLRAARNVVAALRGAPVDPASLYQQRAV